MSALEDDDRKFAPIREYETRTPKPDDPKTDTEIQEDEYHDELEGDDVWANLRPPLDALDDERARAVAARV